MKRTNELEEMYKIRQCEKHGMSPIPQEGEFGEIQDVYQISGFSHACGTCALKQGACKLTLNVKEGIIQEALIETVGCSGMTHSAAMASEILPGLTLLEAMNADLVCDAINVSMREMFLMLAYGRSQSAFTDGGLLIGAGLEDLGGTKRSQVGTAYSTIDKGPRYLEVTEGYIQELALDDEEFIIGYKYVNLGKMMQLISDGNSANDALDKSTGIYGRYNDGVKFINPREE